MERYYRWSAALSAAVWLGGMLVVSITAITMFRVMPTLEGVDQPTAVAGRVMAQIFQKFDTIQLVCAGVLGASQLMLLVSGRRRRADWLRMGLVVVAWMFLVYSAGVLTPRIIRLQGDAAGGPIPTAEIGTFERSHKQAVQISKINFVLVGILAASLTWRRRETPDESHNDPVEGEEA